MDYSSDLASQSDVAVEEGSDHASLTTVLGTAMPAFALAACGGGDDSSTPTASSPVVVTPQVLTSVQASRFLGQATMGATRAMIDNVVSIGYDAWLTAQFATARTTTHWDWLIANGYNAAANSNTAAGFDPTVWRAMISDPDQLRQRVAMALLDILVIGIQSFGAPWRAFKGAAYLDILADNAFTNYRTILGAVTTSVAMGSFLTYIDNQKANPTTGSEPDENYARESMQLFTIGLYMLNMDGSLQLSGGAPIPTYSQADVSGLARVYTGLVVASGSNDTPDIFRQPLVMKASINETGASTFLGTTVTGGGMAAINSALDFIFAHQNVPPFVSRQLIQRLVTSNPSAGYIQRVATVFADNGKGVRGDMQAVIRAILLDDEARGDATLASTSAGRLREPVMRLTGWARAYNVTSPSAAWAIGDTSSPSTRLGESMGRNPSVFNWFRPGYTPPDTAIAAAGLVAPEFQITNEQTVVGYVNFMATLVGSGIGDVTADYTAILTMASDSGALVDEVNTVLAAGQLSAATVTAIRAAVDSVSASATNGPATRVQVAILLTLASPDYLTVK